MLIYAACFPIWAFTVSPILTVLIYYFYMCRRFGADAQGKVHRLLDYTGTPGDIADPWYTRDFETAYAQIEAGCRALLVQLEQAAQ